MSRGITCLRKPLRGISLVEVAVSTMITGFLMIAALSSVGAAKRREQFTIDRVLGQQFAASLMSEILRQGYEETVGAPIFGPETGEATGNRSLFDDVDDYHGWSASPPQSRNGSAIEGGTGWTCSVSVQWANVNTLAVSSASKTGLKRITVTTNKGRTAVTSLVGYRSVAWIDTIPAPADATGNHAPVAVATSTDLTRNVNQYVAFDASSSSDADSDYLSYVWSFGDGSTGTGKSVSHPYQAIGSYTCTLTVYDGRGGVSAASLVAVISP